jgi:hypothetical protein
MTIARTCLAGAILLLAGSTVAAGAPTAGGAKAARPDAATANVQLAMLGQVNPQATALWDITNDAMDDAGALSAARLKAAHWKRLLAIGRALEGSGRALRTARTIVAAPPGAKIADEGPPGVSRAADVQRFIDADTATFRSRSARLEQAGASVVAAARKRDTKALQDLADHLDAVCKDCHVQFWNPQRK